MHTTSKQQILRFAGCTKFRGFIFVIPDDIKVFKCPYQRTPELQELELFSAQVTIDDVQEGQVAPPESSKRKSPLSIKEGKEEPPPKRSKVTCHAFV